MNKRLVVEEMLDHMEILQAEADRTNHTVTTLLMDALTNNKPKITDEALKEIYDEWKEGEQSFWRIKNV